jgi:hypothetical protein
LARAEWHDGRLDKAVETLLGLFTTSAPVAGVPAIRDVLRRWGGDDGPVHVPSEVVTSIHRIDHPGYYTEKEEARRLEQSRRADQLAREIEQMEREEAERRRPAEVLAEKKAALLRLRTEAASV